MTWVLITDKRIMESVDSLAGRVGMVRESIHLKGSTDTKDLTKLKTLCKEFLEIPLIQALRED